MVSDILEIAYRGMFNLMANHQEGRDYGPYRERIFKLMEDIDNLRRDLDKPPVRGVPQKL